MKKSISVVLTGGGTGGHIYPAIAVAQLLKNDPEISELTYIGCKKNPEKDIVEKEQIDFLSLNVSGMPRKASYKFIIWFFELLIASIQAVLYLINLKPNIVFGTGGYVTGPVLIAAKLLNVPYIIHDPDAHPGIVNKFMASGAKKVSLAFEGAKKYIKNPNSEVLGNPMRGNLSSVSKENALKAMNLDPSKKTILAVGGSQGAQKINNAMMGAVPVFINCFGYQVIHQTGKKNYDEYIKRFNEKHPDLKNNPSYIVKPYFDDMSIPLNAADFAISRAGSLSISELNLCKLPSILVPYPFAAADHQRFNAKAMEEAGAGIFMDDLDCSSDRLINQIHAVFDNQNKYEDMKSANQNLAKPDAAKTIVKKLKEVAK